MNGKRDGAGVSEAYKRNQHKRLVWYARKVEAGNNTNKSISVHMNASNDDNDKNGIFYDQRKVI